MPSARFSISRTGARRGKELAKDRAEGWWEPGRALSLAFRVPRRKTTVTLALARSMAFAALTFGAPAAYAASAQAQALLLRQLPKIIGQTAIRS